jgi:hypothetical protein
VPQQVEELRLEQVKMSREKEAIENQLEAEQEYIVNKLQKQAMGLAAEKQALQGEKADLKRQVGGSWPRCSLQSRACAEPLSLHHLACFLSVSSGHLAFFSPVSGHLARFPSVSPGHLAPFPPVSGHLSCFLSTSPVRPALTLLVRSQVEKLQSAVAKLNNDKVLLEQSMEMEEEGIVNRLQRQIGGGGAPLPCPAPLTWHSVPLHATHC